MRRLEDRVFVPTTGEPDGTQHCEPGRAKKISADKANEAKDAFLATAPLERHCVQPI